MCNLSPICGPNSVQICACVKNHLLPLADRLLLRKRAIVETIIDHLKNISQIEHSRHRSVCSFLVNVLSGLTAHSHRSMKPSLGPEHLALMAA